MVEFLFSIRKILYFACLEVKFSGSLLQNQEDLAALLQYHCTVHIHMCNDAFSVYTVECIINLGAACFALTLCTGYCVLFSFVQRTDSTVANWGVTKTTRSAF